MLLRDNVISKAFSCADHTPKDTIYLSDGTAPPRKLKFGRPHRQPLPVKSRPVVERESDWDHRCVSCGHDYDDHTLGASCTLCDCRC